MRIAIFQNFLDNIGGAEVVGLTMARELKADIYTTNINREKVKSMGFADVKIYSIGRVPINAPFRQQMVLCKFRRLNLRNKYDFFIINGDWAVSAAVNNKPNLWYVNATIREIWDLNKYVRKNLPYFFMRPIFDVWSAFNRHLNKKYIASVDAIASNSSFTKERVKKYLNRDSKLIYPPTQTAKFHFEKTGNYWLSVNRLIGYKRVEMQIRAFAKMPEEKLVIIGPYEKAILNMAYVNFIEKIKPVNVEIFDRADTFEELTNYYANCKGFITTCLQEDFGMTAIEAMASGKPVVAPNEGGYKETIVNGKTGILIDNIDENKIIQAIKRIGQNPEKFKENCLHQAKRFDTSVFIKEIYAQINQTKN